uniref:Tail protein n=1 Tax=viral metagenome TaxID=1070528 RepID=A0A6M3INV1_9ZZZZ
MITVKYNLNSFLKAFEKDNNKRIKAGFDAVRVAGYYYVATLQEEIEAGSPGGKKFAPLSELALRSRKAKNRLKPSLFRLFVPVRYTVKQTDKHLKMELGFTGPQVSAKWKKLVDQHQQGFTMPIDKYRRYLTKIGSDVNMKHAIQGKKGVFTPRASTTSLRIPARPIINPFWSKHQSAAWKRIQKYFAMKMAGKRIQNEKKIRRSSASNG